MLACCVMAGRAHARPPAGVDPASPMAVWFNSKTNTVGRSCCGLGDGEILEDNQVRTVGDHYEVMVAGGWHAVPHPGADTSPAGGPNPTGKAVVWWSPCPACAALWSIISVKSGFKASSSFCLILSAIILGILV